ncbi:MAG: hypothetical protein CMO82_11175 [Winogradskyella sp.]|nr:hypothetical protein [Winogradskyella sp.]|tara:strand:+ start:21904 stop:23592 length:1689 start_codon:yes stop_codon:yes gene_type:complete
MKNHQNNVELRYGTFLDQMVAFIAPKDLNIIAGRGTRKTTGIVADRSQEVVYDMPRSVLGFAADTFVNAKDKVLPKLVEGWREYLGWREGVHYVLEDRPPSHFDIPYTPIMTYKNTISIFNGCIFKLGSLDQPSGLAGDSIQHLFGDEVKYFDKKVLDIISPALRGHPQVRHSPFYRGTTFTTDLPNISKKNHDWILDNRDLMDMEKIKAAFQAGSILNEINHKIKRAYDLRNTGMLKKYIKQRERWMVKWYKARKDTTFFMMVSSLVNLDILDNGYVMSQLDKLGWEEFKQSVLTFKSKLEEGERFYVGLGEHHYYDDGIVNEIERQTGFQEKITCKSLRYWDPHAPLDIGVDFGKMISMVVAQEQGKYYRCLKNHYTLIPESSAELGKKFREYWSPHINRTVYMYYDRSGNQYESSGRDWASEVRKHIEYDENGKSTGWNVVLMSREQGNIRQSQEHFFIKQVLQETTKGLPILLIDRYQCRELKSSLELSKIVIGVESRTGIKYIKKDKSSESLPVNKLPLQSTNMSDAFKYLMYRKKWTKLVKYEREYLPTGLDGVVG